MRRSRGEGTVFRASSGYWRGALRLPNGTRVWRTARTRAEVVRKLDELKQRGATSRQLFGAFLDRWLAYVKPNVRGNTYVGYETAVRLWIKPEIGDIKLSTLRAEHVERVLSSVRAKHRSTRTVGFVRSVAIMALSLAERWELVEKNWFKLSGAPKAKKKSCAKPFSSEDALKFLVASESWRDRALMILAASTGARRGEIIGAKWSDFDMDAPSWLIRRSLQRVHGQLIEYPPKSEAGYRTLPLNARVVAALRDHRVSQLEMRMKAGPEWEERDYVFTGREGQPLQPEYVADSFRDLIETAKLPKIRFHDLRHTLATLLLSKRVPIKAVQGFMGHASAMVTLDLYAHLVPELTEQAKSPIE